MDLGEKISLLRKNNNMSQENLAIALDVTRQTVSKWELNETKPKTQTIIALAKFFNVDVHLLLDDAAVITIDVQPTEKNHVSENMEEQIVSNNANKDNSNTKKLFTKRLIILLFIAFVLQIIYIIMSTVFKMSVSAYYLFRTGAYIILFILLVTLLIEIIKYFMRK